LREAKRATGRNNSVVNGCAGRSTGVVDEAQELIRERVALFPSSVLLVTSRPQNEEQPNSPLMTIGSPGGRHYLQTWLSAAHIYSHLEQSTGRSTVKTKYTVALSMLAGIAVGAVAIQGLQR
jgi:hypothetical protein